MWGTEFRTAPEGFRQDIGPHILKTDVWAVGCCLASLMWKHDGFEAYGPSDNPDNTDWEEQLRSNWDSLVNGDDGWQPDLNNDLRVGPYSKDLRDLIDACMRFKPKDRLSFPQLMRRIRQHRDSHNQGLRDAPSISSKWRDLHVQLDTKDHLAMSSRSSGGAEEYEEWRASQKGYNGHAVDLPPAPTADEYANADEDDGELGGVGGDMDID